MTNDDIAREITARLRNGLKELNSFHWNWEQQNVGWDRYISKMQQQQPAPPEPEPPNPITIDFCQWLQQEDIFAKFVSGEWPIAE